MPQNVPTLHTGLRALWLTYEQSAIRSYAPFRRRSRSSMWRHLLPLSRIPGHSITHKVGGPKAGTRCHTPLTAASAISTRR